MAEQGRSHWNSRTGFVMAAAGSAVGLGNIWKFPYITGENGGGAFVLVYLLCILIVGVPVLIGEILLGQASKSSAVGAYRAQGGHPVWTFVGLMAILCSFALLTIYSTVAGWGLHYVYLAITNQIAGQSTDSIPALFQTLQETGWLGATWQFIFLAVTFLVVSAGVSKGLERWAMIMMPSLLVLLLIMLGNAMTLSGWGEGLDFLFGMRMDKLTGQGVLEALGHSFFTLSLGGGMMVTYGSYLRAKDDAATASVVTAGMDTLVAMIASTMLFPIVFSFGLEPGAGPGLLFVTVPIALSQMTGGAILAVSFFVMLVFAALTSAIALLEVVVAYLIDEHGMVRRKASLISAIAILACGIPATLSAEWFNIADILISKCLMPFGGLGIALLVAWRMDAALRQGIFEEGSALARFYRFWLWMLKYPAPISILLIILHSVEII